jgi:hypothetical protein
MHFYSLTKLQPHPLAKEHILIFPYRLSDNQAAPFILVMDDMVYLHASTAGGGSPEGGIGIWDWKRGVAVSVCAHLPDLSYSRDPKVDKALG